MNRTAELAEAREVDTRIAAEWSAYYDKLAEAVALQKKILNDTRLRDRMPRLAAQLQASLLKAERRMKVLEAESTVFRIRAEEIEFNEYKGWSRFFLVEHIHSSQNCSSFRPTTRVGWLPDVSGLTEAEAVKEHGATLCTICFPSAPVELTTKPVDESVCTGSGTFVNTDLPHRTGYYTGNWGTCPECNERVTIVGQSGRKLRKHKK